MRIGVCTVDLYIPGTTSLKGKRRVIKSLKHRLRNQFNVAVAEVDGHELLQRATIGVAMISTDGRKLNSDMAKVIAFIEKTSGADLIDHQIEIL